MERVLEPGADWDELMLPAGQIEQLRALVASVPDRTTVLEHCGFARRSGRGVGITALFRGGRAAPARRSPPKYC
jgi:hypothetical protein